MAGTVYSYFKLPPEREPHGAETCQTCHFRFKTIERDAFSEGMLTTPPTPQFLASLSLCTSGGFWRLSIFPCQCRKKFSKQPSRDMSCRRYEVRSRDNQLLKTNNLTSSNTILCLINTDTVCQNRMRRAFPPCYFWFYPKDTNPVRLTSTCWQDWINVTFTRCLIQMSWVKDRVWN